MRGHIYLITNTINGKQYIGCTIKPIEKRWRGHLNEARRGCAYALHRAIRKYGAKSFQVECLEEVADSHEALLAAEVRWIADLQSQVPRGYNLTDGGQGIDFSVPETRRRQIEGSRKRSASPEWLKAQSEAKKKLYADPDYHQRHTVLMQTLAQDPEWKSKNIEIVRRMPSDPKWREAHKAGVAKRTQDPAWKAALTEGARRRSRDPDWLKANAELLEKTRATTSARALERDALFSPEERLRRQKQREAVRRSYAKRKRERDGTD